MSSKSSQANTPEFTLKQFFTFSSIVFILLIGLLIVQNVYQAHISQRTQTLESFFNEQLKNLTQLQAKGKDLTNKLLIQEEFAISQHWLKEQQSIIKTILRHPELKSPSAKHHLRRINLQLKQLDEKIRTWQYWADKFAPIHEDIISNRSFNLTINELHQALSKIDQQQGEFFLQQATAFTLKPTGIDKSKQRIRLKRKFYLDKLKNKYTRLLSSVAMASREFSTSQLENIEKNLIMPDLLSLFMMIDPQQAKISGTLEYEILRHLQAYSIAIFGSHFKLTDLLDSKPIINGGFLQLRTIYLDLQAEGKRYLIENAQIFSQISQESFALQQSLKQETLKNQKTLQANLHIIWLFSAMVILAATLFLFTLARNLLCEIKLQFRALSLSRAQLKNTIDSTWDGFITLDEAGKVISFNHAAKRIFGENNIQTNISIQQLIPGIELSNQNIQNQLVEITGKTHQEINLPMEISITQTQSIDQKESHFVLTVRDISQSIRLRAAEAANKSKSEFLSSMSHELRTPLNAIIGFSELLEISDLTQKQHRQVKNIHASGSHLLELINDVLEFAKIESGKLALSIEEVALYPVLQEVLSITYSAAQELNIEITVDTDQSDYVLLADKVRLKQVILNILSNAIKYNRPNGKIKISYQTTHDGKALSICITDTGLGISKEQIANLFQAFNRLGREATSIEGTGIGLTITKTLLERMDGNISVDSVENEGSTFIIELPLVRRQSIDKATSNTYPSALVTPTTETVDQSKKRVLYVEDNETNIELMQDALETLENIELLSCLTAEEGLEKARTFKPHIVLMDINLPGLNGDEALPFYKALPELRETKTHFYAISANAMEEQVQEALRAGFEDYLIKPVKIEALKPVIQKTDISTI